MHTSANNMEKPAMFEAYNKTISHRSDLYKQHQAQTKLESCIRGIWSKKCPEKSPFDMYTFTQYMQKPLTFDPRFEDFPHKSGLIGQNQMQTFPHEVDNNKCTEKSQCNMQFDTSDKGNPNDICSKEILDKSDLNRDNPVCMKKSFTCTICSKSFSRKSDLTRHYCIHTKEMPFMCQLCNKGFYHQGHLLRHIRVHTNETPFVCEVCNKGFSHSGYLKVHLRIHTNDRSFQCEICNKGFLQNSDLIRHKRIHTQDKPFVCEICQDGFSRKDHLKRHMSTHT